MNKLKLSAVSAALSLTLAACGGGGGGGGAINPAGLLDEEQIENASALTVEDFIGTFSILVEDEFETTLFGAQLTDNRRGTLEVQGDDKTNFQWNVVDNIFTVRLTIEGTQEKIDCFLPKVDGEDQVAGDEFTLECIDSEGLDATFAYTRIDDLQAALEENGPFAIVDDGGNDIGEVEFIDGDLVGNAEGEEIDGTYTVRENFFLDLRIIDGGINNDRCRFAGLDAGSYLFRCRFDGENEDEDLTFEPVPVEEV